MGDGGGVYEDDLVLDASSSTALFGMSEVDPSYSRTGSQQLSSSRDSEDCSNGGLPRAMLTPKFRFTPPPPLSHKVLYFCLLQNTGKEKPGSRFTPVLFRNIQGKSI